jgi:hypothetical protein
VSRRLSRREQLFKREGAKEEIIEEIFVKTDEIMDNYAIRI